MKILAALVAVLCIGCGNSGSSINPKNCAGSCGGQVYVVDAFTFVTATADGVAPGFNIDGISSDGEAPRDCLVEDLTAPDGTPGIDNQLASILTSLPPQVYNILPPAIQTSVNEGGLIFLLEVLPDAGGIIARYGAGDPILGTDQRFLPDQTFLPAEDPILGYALEIEDLGDHNRTQPFDLDFRLVFLETKVTFRFLDARIQWQAHQERMTGVIGGAVTLEDILAVVGLLGGDDTQLRETLKAILPSFADVYNEKTDDCDRISAALTFSAVPAFIAP